MTFLYLLIWQFYILQGKFLLVETDDEKELVGIDKSLERDGNRMMKHFKHGYKHKKKSMKPRIQKNLKSSGREHTVYSQDENKRALNEACKYMVPVPPVVLDVLVRK